MLYVGWEKFLRQVLISSVLRQTVSKMLLPEAVSLFQKRGF